MSASIRLGAFLAVLADGSWLTRERVAVAAGATAAFTVATLAFLMLTSHAGIDIMDRPIGTDFASFYSAGREVLTGHAFGIYDPATHFAAEQAIFGPATQYYGWFYPPFFLLIATPLATLPYLVAVVLWQLATLALYALTLRAITAATAPALLRDRLWWLVAFGFPAVFVNAGHGQNAFLSAALLGGALVLLDRRPIVAGILVGLLAYKPQLGVLVPLILIATGRWTTFAAAAITVAVLAAIVTALFGPAIWPAYFHASAAARLVLFTDDWPGWDKIQTVYAWVRLWNGSAALAYTMQTTFTAATAIGLALLWRRPVPYALKAGGLAIAAVVAAPFSLDYDMVLLAIAIAFLAGEGSVRGFAPWQKTAVAVLWLVPLIARSAARLAFIPLGPMAMVASLAFVFWAAWRQHEAPVRGALLHQER